LEFVQCKELVEIRRPWLKIGGKYGIGVKGAEKAGQSLVRGVGVLAEGWIYEGNKKKR
jgi:hypothetical protein